MRLMIKVGRNEPFQMYAFILYFSIFNRNKDSFCRLTILIDLQSAVELQNVRGKE